MHYEVASYMNLLREREKHMSLSKAHISCIYAYTCLYFLQDKTDLMIHSPNASTKIIKCVYVCLCEYGFTSKFAETLSYSPTPERVCELYLQCLWIMVNSFITMNVILYADGPEKKTATIHLCILYLISSYSIFMMTFKIVSISLNYNWSEIHQHGNGSGSFSTLLVDIYLFTESQNIKQPNEHNQPPTTIHVHVPAAVQSSSQGTS